MRYFMLLSILTLVLQHNRLSLDGNVGGLPNGSNPMKKYLILLAFMSCWHCSSLLAQQPLDQLVTIQVENKLLVDVFYQLIDEEAVNLSFRNELIPNQKVSIDFQNRPLWEVLDQLLSNTRLRYRVLGNQILLIRRVIERPKTYYTISGFIEDELSGERLIGANIIDLNSERGTISNEYGFFSISLPEGEVHLRSSYLGYQATEQLLTLEGNLSTRIELGGSITLNEVIIYARDSTANPIGGLATGNYIGLRETHLLPSLAGEPDVFRTAHLLPGVTTGADGAEGVQVRGGDAGQNLVLLDGVPVYYVNHAIGLFSIFNSDAIRSTQLLRGGFPARYGGRLSSVLDIRMKEGNKQSFHASAGTGLLSTRFLLEGPIVSDRSSFLVAGRWSFVHPFLRPQSRAFKESRGTTGQTDYRFYDINAKFNYSFSNKNRVFLSFYRGKDNYDDLTTDFTILELNDQNDEVYNALYRQSYGEGFSWGNTVGSLRWNHLFSDQLFSNFSFTYSRLDQESFYNLEDIVDKPIFNQIDTTLVQGLFRSGIEDIGAKADLQWVANTNTEVRFGLGGNRRIFKPGALIVNEALSTENPFQNNSVNTTELSTYLEGQGRWRKRWNWNGGVHLAWWYVRSKGHLSVQPRLSINYEANERLTANVSVSRMVQNMHFLRNTTVNLPTEIWVPSTDQIQPSDALHGEVGLSYKLSDTWRLQTDAYYKRLHQLLTFKEGVEGFRNWEENVTSGDGEAYGAELQLNKVKGKLTGWLSYTYSRSLRRFEELNLDRVYPFRYDRPHNLKIAGVYSLMKGWYFSANWSYSSGFALTLPLVKFTPILPGEIPPNGGFPLAIDPIAKNNIRMPVDHRLDINLHHEWTGAKGWKHEFNIGVYNVYNRNNPLYYDIRRFLVVNDGESTTEYSFVEVQLAPILPILSYQIKF